MNDALGKRIGLTIGDIQQGEELERAQAASCLSAILNETSREADFMWAGLFAAIQSRGPTLEEVEGFIDAVHEFDPSFHRSQADRISISSGLPVASITGSGKDSWKTFNISTTAAFIAAACGVRVLKPGSQATSSTTGAIDLLWHLDLPEVHEIGVAAELLETVGLSILSFANCVPRYAERYDGRFFWFHPLSYILPPLAIPFRLDALVYGIADPNTDFSLDLLMRHGPKNCAVVATELRRGYLTDELIPFGKSMVSVHVDGARFTNQIYNPVEKEPLEIAHQATHALNARVLQDVLTARKETPAVRAAAMAAASILVTAGHKEGLQAAYRDCVAAVLDGSAQAVLERYRIAAKRLVRPMINVPSPDVVEKAQDAKRQIDCLAARYGYPTVTPTTRLFGVGDGFLASRFAHCDNLAAFDEVGNDARAIVTGFGPTNAPTAGTLSVLLKALSLQDRLGCDIEIIISDLGAFLSRNRSWEDLRETTAVFLRFVHLLAGDRSGVVIRSHIDKDNLSLGALINEKMLSTETFLANKEATELLYEELGILGSKLGVIADSTYTVADIVKPLFRDTVTACEIQNRRRVLVLAGIEEHYFPRLAKLAVDRLNRENPGTYTDPDVAISALYTRLVPGLGPFPKMSKSIPASGVFLDDSEDEIHRKIVEAGEAEQDCIREMICQASDWSDAEIAMAERAHARAATDPQAWRDARLRYAATFARYAGYWRQAKALTGA